MMKEIAQYKHCFVCGEENVAGIRAKFYWNGKEAWTTVTALADFEGYLGIYHGGIVATLLDEVMLKAVLAGGHFAVTAEITVRYKKPVTTGVPIRFVGRIVEQKGRMFRTEAEALDSEGQPYATATARFLEAKAELKSQLLKSID